MDMNYLLNSVFMIVVLTILFVWAFPTIKEKKSRSRCLMLIGGTALYVLSDWAFIAAISWQDCPMELLRAIVLFFYIVYVIVPFAWHMYVRNFVGRSYPKFIFYLELIPLVFLLFVVFINMFTHVLYRVGDGVTLSRYTRGSWYWPYTIINFFYYLEPFIDLFVVIILKRWKEEPYSLQSAIISSIPLLGAIINGFVIPKDTVFPFLPFCSVAVAMLAFFFMGSKESQRLEKERQDVVEKALVKAQEAMLKAEEASRVKTVFLSNMSHDIRTPMNAIINLTHLAQEEKDSKKIHDYLDKLAISGEFLLNLINDILDMSRIESGEIDLKKERFPREEFNKTIETVIQPLMDKKHINFHMSKKGGDCDILTDKTRFNQIFLKKLLFARKGWNNRPQIGLV